MSNLDARFFEASEEAKDLSARPDDDTLLRLYALYKQATVGDVEGKRPGMLNPVGRAKYDAWAEEEGMSSDEAKRRYVALVEELKRTD